MSMYKYVIFDHPKKSKTWNIKGYQNLCLKLGVEPDELDSLLKKKRK
jgi:hypothetical protein